jgi:hypothetical protein
MFDTSYAEACALYYTGLSLWMTEHPTGLDEDGYAYWDAIESPPDSTSYRRVAWTEQEASAYQVYETVTEGTPVSPVLPTVVAAYQWLKQHGMQPLQAIAFLYSQYPTSCDYGFLIAECPFYLGGDTAYWGVNTRRTWNGFACPKFSFDVARQILDDSSVVTYNIESNAKGERVFVVTELEYADDPERYEPDDQGFYHIGSGSWIWTR